jgi:hypothetical protein
MKRNRAMQLVGRQPKWALRNMRQALEMLPTLNTPEDWQRLNATYTVLRTPHKKRLNVPTEEMEK